ncbi:MAG: phosphatidate cytidylyltransferase [Flavobacteriaceae bacterium]|nr:phosphatidate cytidylyltransferase [Flavobacteriaceae bacterium]
MKELLIRAISGLAYVALIIGSALYSKESFYAVFFILMLFCLFEFKRLIDLKYNWAYIVAALIYFRFSELEVFNSKYFHFFLIISLFIPFIYQLFITKISIASSKIGHFLLSIGYIALPFSFLTSIPFINGEYHPKTIISIFALIWANDSFAYIVGSTLGRTKLYEKISPNKTIEGTIGGFIATLIAAYFLAEYVPILTLTSWLIIAILVVIFGVLGDLIESKFKREAQVKDSSNFIPGHGGFLDRLDSIIFAAPFVYVYLHLFY